VFIFDAANAQKKISKMRRVSMEN